MLLRSTTHRLTAWQANWLSYLVGYARGVSGGVVVPLLLHQRVKLFIPDAAGATTIATATATAGFSSILLLIVAVAIATPFSNIPTITSNGTPSIGSRYPLPIIVTVSVVVVVIIIVSGCGCGSGSGHGHPIEPRNLPAEDDEHLFPRRTCLYERGVREGVTGAKAEGMGDVIG